MTRTGRVYPLSKLVELSDLNDLAVMQIILSDVENLDWQEMNQILVETAK